MLRAFGDVRFYNNYIIASNTISGTGAGVGIGMPPTFSEYSRSGWYLLRRIYMWYLYAEFVCKLISMYMLHVCYTE